MSQQFERWAEQTMYWDVPDLNLMGTEDAFSRIEKYVNALIQQLKNHHAPNDPGINS